MPHPTDAVLGGMREIELHDDFWPGALDALTLDAPSAALRDRWPALAELLDELEADARQGPLLVGLRLATPRRNSRLFAILAGAILARAGSRVLVLDLSSDTRWLEQVLGADFKEGLVDHLRFGVPIERCVRPTALDRFAVVSAGAAFLAGSPLDDAPGLRSALDRLRQRHRVVLVTLPPPIEAGNAAGSGDATGIAALCDALVTVEEKGESAAVLGSERAVVRLLGDPEAARDLARLTRRFLGPLTSLVAGLSLLRQGTGVTAGLPSGGVPPTAVAAPVVRAGRPAAAARPAAPAPSVPAAPPRSRRRAAVAAILVLGTLAAIGYAGRETVYDVVVRVRDGTRHGAAGEAVGQEQGASVAAPVDLAAAVTSAPDIPPPPARPAPWSLHVGSYQRVESAMRVVERVEAAGLAAYLAPVSLPGKGSWQRVFVGAFADSAGAQEALARLQREGVVQEGAVRSTPWAFELGFYATAEEARAEAEALRRAGIVAYVAGHDPVRLYAGAYRDQEEADLLSRMLDAALGGRAVTLMLREE